MKIFKFFALSLAALAFTACDKDDNKNVQQTEIAGVYTGKYDFKVNGTDQTGLEVADMTIEKIDKDYCRVKFCDVPAAPGMAMQNIVVDSVKYAFSEKDGYKLNATNAQATGSFMGRAYTFDRLTTSFAGKVKDKKFDFDFNFTLVVAKMNITHKVEAKFNGLKK